MGNLALMNELPQSAEPEETEFEAPTSPVEPAADERTGVTVVDDVLDSLGTLDGQPLSEHVQVFERAHDQLRRALDTPTDH